MSIDQKFHFDFWGLLDDEKTKLVKAIARNNVAVFNKHVNRVNLKTCVFGPGWTLLHYACILGRTEITDIILQQNAPLDALTPCHETALFMAIRHKHFDCAKKLLQANANPHIRAVNIELRGKVYPSLSPLELCQKMGLDKMEAILKRYIDSFQGEVEKKIGRVFDLFADTTVMAPRFPQKRETPFVKAELDTRPKPVKVR